MDFNYQPDLAMKAGTAGGLLLVLLIKLDSTILVETAVVAATGAFVSYCVSVFLKWMIRKLGSPKSRKPGV
ncbi:MAG: hypothetical protein H0U44_04100 [Flavisolibacter sp.]|nr:hypothetical protein [Flavisolibacter sp.]